MFCDHCGKQIPDDAALCPYCGMSTGESRQPVTYYDVEQQAHGNDASLNTSKDDFSHFGGPLPSAPPVPPVPPQAAYQNGYRAVPLPPRPPYASSVPPVAPGYPVQQPGYGPQSMNYAAYAPHMPRVPQFIPVVPAVPVVTSQAHMKRDNAVLLEVILSLFGLFGIGWLAGGETTVGIILLICSFVIYLPVLFLGTILTFGVGMVCLGPLAIVAIILNGVFCNSILKRREIQFIVMQQPPPMGHMPPPMQRRVQQ